MKTILLAEDNAANRELFREILEAGGFHVLEASDGEQAIAIAAANSPDLALLDIQMPARDGIEVLQAIRSDPRLMHTPVIALTAFAMRGDRERMLQVGFDGYLSKPASRATLLAEVNRALNLQGAGATQAR